MASVRIPFDDTYAYLPQKLFSKQNPTPVAAPRLVKLNHKLAELLNIDPQQLESLEGIAILSGNAIADGSTPIATAYAGHQFGHFVPQLGDGRAILLGEVVGRDGRRRDIQLKGAGRTPYSRGGDGRAAIGPVLREYIVSEAMAALGVPTTRALAAVTTGEPVYRDAILPGAVLTRVAASHIRVGTFQFAALQDDPDVLRALADLAISRHDPRAADAANPYLALLEGVVARQAELIAHWLLIGFIHGVMNTDNTAISGETIDFGPCAFMDAYDPGTVFSSIDQAGRYAYGNQPRIAQWNLARLAETLLRLIDADEQAAVAKATDALEGFAPRFQATYIAGLRRKLGLFEERAGDAALAEDLLTRMAENAADFTLTFRRLADAAEGPDGDAALRTLFTNPQAYDSWALGWRARLAEEHVSPAERAASMRRVNPAYIPRNHRVEAALAAATNQSDYAPFEELLAVLAHPFDEQPGRARFAEPPAADERVLQTFCGT